MEWVRKEAVEIVADAVIAVDLDYVEFSGAVSQCYFLQQVVR